MLQELGIALDLLEFLYFEARVGDGWALRVRDGELGVGLQGLTAVELVATVVVFLIINLLYTLHASLSHCPLLRLYS